MIEAAGGLGARGHGCTLLGRPGTAWLRAAGRRGVPVREGICGAWIQRVLRVRAAMRDFQPDVVIAKAKKAARMAAFGRSTGGGGRAVVFFGATHELDPRRGFDRFTWRAVDAGIVVAAGAAEWYVERGFGPRSKLHVLWNGVELSSSRARGAREWRRRRWKRWPPGGRSSRRRPSEPARRSRTVSAGSSSPCVTRTRSPTGSSRSPSIQHAGTRSGRRRGGASRSASRRHTR